MSVLHTPQLIRVNFICAYNPLPKFANNPALATAIPLLVLIVVYRPFLRAQGKTQKRRKIAYTVQIYVPSLLELLIQTVDELCARQRQGKEKLWELHLIRSDSEKERITRSPILDLFLYKRESLLNQMMQLLPGNASTNVSIIAGTSGTGPVRGQFPRQLDILAGLERDIFHYCPTSDQSIYINWWSFARKVTAVAILCFSISFFFVTFHILNDRTSFSRVPVELISVRFFFPTREVYRVVNRPYFVNLSNQCLWIYSVVLLQKRSSRFEIVVSCISFV